MEHLRHRHRSLLGPPLVTGPVPLPPAFASPACTSAGTPCPKNPWGNREAPSLSHQVWFFFFCPSLPQTASETILDHRIGCLHSLELGMGTGVVVRKPNGASAYHEEHQPSSSSSSSSPQTPRLCPTQTGWAWINHGTVTAGSEVTVGCGGDFPEL